MEIDNSTGLLVQPTPQRNQEFRKRTELLDIILGAWTSMPGQRLGQLIDNAVGRAGGADTFNIEDDKLAEAVKKFSAEFGLKKDKSWVANGM